jgi:hypothetical protein
MQKLGRRKLERRNNPVAPTTPNAAGSRCTDTAGAASTAGAAGAAEFAEFAESVDKLAIFITKIFTVKKGRHRRPFSN